MTIEKFKTIEIALMDIDKYRLEKLIMFWKLFRKRWVLIQSLKCTLIEVMR